MANFKGIATFTKTTILIFIYVNIRSVLGLSGERIGELRTKLLTGYDKHAIPIADDKPVEVAVEVVLNDMVPREKADMHFSIDMLFNLHWYDYRLKYNFTLSGHDFVTFDYSFLEEIWSPSLFFVESKAGNRHTHPQPNVLVNIYPDGKIVYVQRLAVHSFCLMKMQFYPFDIQRCNLTIEPFSYNTDFIELKWIDMTNRSKTSAKLYHHDFNQVDVLYGSDSFFYKGLGNFSRVYLQFTLHRHLAVYILRDFFPCMIIVCLSWTSFWINFKSTPARVALGITTILTMFAVTNSIRDYAPQVGSFRSIDVYMLTCNLLTIFALFEYALVGMTAPNLVNSMKYKQHRTKGVQKCAINKGYKPTPEQNGSNGHAMNGHATTKIGVEDEEKEVETCIQYDDGRPVTKSCGLLFYNDQTHVIDRIARVLFPVTFVLFNAGYFIFHRLSPETVN